MLDVVISTGGLQVDFWVASDYDTEKVSIPLFNEPDEVSGVGEPVLDGSPILDSKWRISSEGKNIPDVGFLCPIESVDDEVSGHTGASNVHQNLQVEVVGDVVAQFDG